MNYLLPSLLVGAIIASGLAYWRGDAAGYARSERHHAEQVAAKNAELATQGEKLVAEEIKRLNAERALEDLEDELDALAKADPLANRPAFGSDSMRRLNRIGN